ncbi:MAG: HEAT repeat domain-containing protein [Planctomycetota bacterium]
MENKTRQFANVAHSLLIILLVFGGCSTSRNDIVSWQERGDYDKIIGALNDVHKRASVRAEAARALGEAKSPQAVEPLIRVAENTSEPIGLRVDCVRSLARIGDERSLTCLRSLAKDSTQQYIPAKWDIKVPDGKLQDVPLYWLDSLTQSLFPTRGSRLGKTMDFYGAIGFWYPSYLWRGKHVSEIRDPATRSMWGPGDICTPLALHRRRISPPGDVKGTFLNSYAISLVDDNFIFMGTAQEVAMLESWGAETKQLEGPRVVFPVREAAQRVLSQPGQDYSPD